MQFLAIHASMLIIMGQLQEFVAKSAADRACTRVVVQQVTRSEYSTVLGMLSTCCVYAHVEMVSAMSTRS